MKQAYVAYAWVHPCFSKSFVRETQQLLGLIRNADSLVQPTTNEPAISVLTGPPDAYISRPTALGHLGNVAEQCVLI